MNKNDLDATTLRSRLKYDEDTGLFKWLVDHPLSMFKIGDIAGSKVKATGYVRLSVFSNSYAAHRLAWLYVTGQWPKHQIDHIDGCRSNNAFSNLRDVTGSVNAQNKRAAGKGKKEPLGVCRTKDGKFQASIFVNKKLIHLGLHKTPELAHAVYLNAKRTHHEGNTL